MPNRKFEIGDRVKVRRYPKISLKVHTRYGGHIGKVKSIRHIKGRLWYMVYFGRSFSELDDQEEFKAGELTKVNRYLITDADIRGSKK